MVPGLSIFFMGVSFVLSVGLPVFLYMFWRKKFSLRGLPLLTGVVAFITFAMVLEQLLHMLVLRPDENGNIALIETNPAFYVVYGLLAAGIFEETARLLSFKLLKKKYSGMGTALSYGIGHGGVEAGLIAGIAMLSNLAASIMMNTGAEMDMALLAPLLDTSPYLFLISGIERVFAITIHISLSVLVWHAVNKKGKFWLYPAAILLHGVVNLPAALAQVGVLTNFIFIESIIGVEAAALAFIAYYVYKKMKNSGADAVKNS